MKYRKLGLTGLDCSLLGFGTWQIGGGRWKGLELNESISLLQKAAYIGVNIFDAAIVYGQYRNETNDCLSHSLNLLGRAFPGPKRSEIIICLKVGQIDEYSHKAIFEPRNIVNQIQSALKQMGTDYIDICLIHAPTITEIKERRALTILQTLQTLGLIRFIGYSFESEYKHAELALNQNIDVMMLQYNLIDIECEGIFAKALENGIGILVGGPFKRGYLTGKYSSVIDLPVEDNYWAWNLKYAKCKVEDTLSKVQYMKKNAGSALNLRKIALHSILRHQGASSIIVGHRLENEVIENTQMIFDLVSNC